MGNKKHLQSLRVIGQEWQTCQRCNHQFTSHTAEQDLHPRPPWFLKEVLPNTLNLTPEDEPDGSPKNGGLEDVSLKKEVLFRIQPIVFGAVGI